MLVYISLPALYQ